MPTVIHVSVIIQEGERILLVQEEKAANRDKWNLPGGHLEFCETVQEGARREAREETGLDVTLTNLVGIYTGIRPEFHAIRFVFRATRQQKAEPIAGHEILAVRWFSLDELEALPDAQLVGIAALRRILGDIRQNRSYPLALLTDHVTR